jgi:hypothetical protein
MALGEITRRLHVIMDAATALPSDDIDGIEQLIQVGSLSC